MPFRTWVFAVALGLIAFHGSAQESVSNPEVNPSQGQSHAQEQPAEVPPSVPPPVAAPANPPGPEHDGGRTDSRDGDPSEGSYLILGDGWAQWAMALLTLLGVSISGWAVWLLKRTLDATLIAVRETANANSFMHEANEIASAIGFSQVSAYATITNISAGGHGDAVMLHIRNLGKTPALSISASANIKIALKFEQFECNLVMGNHPDSIGIGQDCKIDLNPTERWPREKFERHKSGDSADYIAQNSVTGTITLMYRDVFGYRITEQFTYSGVIPNGVVGNMRLGVSYTSKPMTRKKCTENQD